MKLYFQHPPTGEFPSLGLDFYQEDQRADLYMVEFYPSEHINEKLRPFNGWFPFNGPEYPCCAHLSPRNGFLGIPGFNIEGSTFDEIVVTTEELIREHPNSEEGAFGIWSRGLYQLLPDCFDTYAGIVWHPDPEAFEKCQAQADLDSRTWKGRKLDGDLRWLPFMDLRTMWASAFIKNPLLNRALINTKGSA